MNFGPTKTDLQTYDVLLNSTSLTRTACEQDYHMTVVRGLKTLEQREALDMGNAIHKYAELRALGHDNAGALTPTLAGYSGSHVQLLVKACMHMPADIPSPYTEPDGRKYVELKFKIFWKTIVYNGAAYNIWVCGTFDIVSLTSDYIVRIRDYKSTRLWKAAEVFDMYRKSVQARFYIWAAQKFGHHMFDVPVANATDANRLYLQHTGIFLSGDTPRWVHGSPIQLTMDELTEFEKLLDNQLITIIVPAFRSPLFRGMVNGTCGKCQFSNYCFEATEQGRENALQTFEHIPYDPMTFRT